jgi:hypothetical protein
VPSGATPETVPDPAPPTNFTSSKSAANVVLSWVNPTTAGFRGVRVYRNTVNSFGTASLITTIYGAAGQPSGTSDNSLAAATYYWWLKSVNSKGVLSTLVGPQSQTIP